MDSHNRLDCVEQIETSTSRSQNKWVTTRVGQPLNKRARILEQWQNNYNVYKTTQAQPHLDALEHEANELKFVLR